MRVVVHDYGGYGFPVELSRELAGRGHEVLHLHCAEVSTGKGRLERHPADPATLAIESVAIGRPMAKYSYSRRLPLEWRYGGITARRMRAFAPDVVISANTPVLAQTRLRADLDRRTRFVVWQQDLVSVAIQQILRRTMPLAAPAAGLLFGHLERRIARRADHVVAISDAFVERLQGWGVRPDRILLVPNWAPLDEVVPRPRQNAWAARLGLTDRLTFLYAGTLGFKHDPDVLIRLAQSVEPLGGQVVVVSEGEFVERLRTRADGVAGLRILPFQPYDQLSDMLGAADVLVAILEAEAADYSVPSKVLTYHAAGRPILASIPLSNAAATMIDRAGSGLVAAPGDLEALLDGARHLASSPDERARRGHAARAFAEAEFDITRITDEFERLLRTLTAPRRTTSRRRAAFAIGD